MVLTWNNFEDTDECLRSLAAQTHARLEMIVVDNGSTDGSVERLIEAWGPKIRVIRLADNLGVGSGYNAGIRAAIEHGAGYVLLLNNDVVLRPELVASLLPAFDAVPRLGTVTPMITYFEDPEQLWFAGGLYSRLWGVSRHRVLAKHLSAADGLLGRLYPTDYIPTCAAMTPVRVFEDVGLLDERFFLGHDDIDWAIRLRAKGYEMRVVGQPLVAHKVSVSAGVRGSNVLTPLQAYHYARGSLLVAAKWARGWRLAPYLVGQLLGRLPYYAAQMLLQRRWAGLPAYARGLRDGYHLYLRRREVSRQQDDGH